MKLYVVVSKLTSGVLIVTDNERTAEQSAIDLEKDGIYTVTSTVNFGEADMNEVERSKPR